MSENPDENRANGWNEWSRFVLAELTRAGGERDQHKLDLEKFIEKTFKEFLKEEHKPLVNRMVKVERVIWALGGAWVIIVAILIWGIQQLLSSTGV
jgi:hypothetical protein